MRPASGSPRLPLAILGVMTVVSFGGPFALRAILMGGAQPGWPPDRPVEWIALTGICGLVAILMIILLFMNFRLRREIRAATGPAEKPQ